MDINTNPASNSEGFDKKMENPNKRGVNNILLWNSEGTGG